MLSSKSYTYHSSTMSLCNECLKQIQAKIIIEDGKVYILKYCSEHGEQKELLQEDSTYYLLKNNYDKPSTSPKVDTKVSKGCPYDCGICPQHDQHGCISLIEVTQRCNMSCPTCYASCSPHIDGGKFLDLGTISKMLDYYQKCEDNNAEVLQISGGEPTLHPQIIDIVHMAQDKGIKYVMLNTNGLRIADDEEFVRELSKFKSGFELYLQFDGFTNDIYRSLRGKDMYEIKEKALQNIVKYQIPATLVCTVSKNVNDHVLDEIIKYGIDTPCIRGINFQPLAYFGRTDKMIEDRITLSGIINRIEAQTNKLLMKDDFIPLPCNVERVAITYMYRPEKGSFIPLTRKINIGRYKSIINNTFMFKVEDIFKNATSGLPICDCMKFIKDFKFIVPKNFFKRTVEQKKEFIDNNTFRISINSFIDRYNFDLKSMQKECVHIITPELRRIPFSSYNMIHRQKGNG